MPDQPEDTKCDESSDDFATNSELVAAELRVSVCAPGGKKRGRRSVRSNRGIYFTTYGRMKPRRKAALMPIISGWRSRARPEKSFIAVYAMKPRPIPWLML